MFKIGDKSRDIAIRGYLKDSDQRFAETTDWLGRKFPQMPADEKADVAKRLAQAHLDNRDLLIEYATLVEENAKRFQAIAIPLIVVLSFALLGCFIV